MAHPLFRRIKDLARYIRPTITAVAAYLLARWVFFALVLGDQYSRESPSPLPLGVKAIGGGSRILIPKEAAVFEFVLFCGFLALLAYLLHRRLRSYPPGMPGN